MNAKFKPVVDALTNLALWFERRLHIVKIWESSAGHPIPKAVQAGSIHLEA